MYLFTISSKLVDELFEKFIDEQLIAYYNDNLENEFPDFKYVMDCLS